jgi:Flp pilus assembly protein TadG
MRAAKTRRGHGQSLVEFALTVPLLFIAILGIAEGGYYVVATTIVSHATSEGARYAILESTTTRDQVRTRVQQRAAPVVSLPSGDVSLAITRADGTVFCTGCSDAQYALREPGDRLQVRTLYLHRPLVGSVFPGLTFPANAESELRVEGETT